ncbi:hypothetical protein [Marinivivus vitaminiproducens]|uniref:hypothetical protein n=1 Tax=Marinivivus vitaminiproducens TaxID=3035935 RepID=UPI002797CB52|nr:hypothetical protein P4R82_09640 [Geminicoccaceae bacterium SCSIO 64248]
MEEPLMAGRLMLAVVGIASVAGLAGCVVVDGDGGYGRERTVSYRCDDDRRFAARFDGDRADVQASDRTWRLERTGSGEYESDDGDVRLRVSGSEAELRLDDRDYENCEASDRYGDDDDGGVFGGLFQSSSSYQCDGPDFTVVSSGNDEVIVESDGRRYRLEETDNDEYEGDDARLILDGNRASLRTDEGRYEDCRLKS